MIPSSNLQSPPLLEIAVQLGGMLYTENSTIKVIRRLKKDDTAYFDGVDVVLNSENIVPVFPIYSLGNSSVGHRNEILDMFDNRSLAENISVIWLSQDTNTDDMNYVFQKQGLFDTNQTTNLHLYRLTMNKNMKTILSVSHHQNLTYINIRNHEIVRTLGSTLFPNLCKNSYAACKGMYRCRMSKVCISLAQVCDGRKHCPFSDDEGHCGLKCPMGCKCGKGTISCRDADQNGNDINVAPITRILDVSNTRKIGRAFLQSIKINSSLLILLNVSRCHVETIDSSSFEFIYNLITLDLSHNVLTALSRNTFSTLKFLKDLYLHGNRQLQSIEPGAFRGLVISSLIINQANIRLIAKNTFSGLNLTILDISKNHIENIKDFAFGGLYSYAIDISNNPIKVFSKELFAGVQGVNQIQTSAYKFCCVRPVYVSEDNCLPYKDEFSSCEDLMRKTALRVLLWIVGFMALLGNITSLVYRILYDKKRLKLGYGIFVTNLAVADTLMGIYMLIIAVADTIFMDRYIEMDEQWRNSLWCKLAGILSTTSSEASVLFMCLITIDRILVIKFPFGQHRFNTRSAILASFVSWILALTIALAPVVHIKYFQDKFYSKSAVCLALPLTRDRPPGWMYSILIFIGFNLVTFVLIAVGQLLIYTEINKHASLQKKMHIARTQDLKVARNLLLVVTTDFLCWFPIGMMGILALSGHTISSEVYAWTAVLVLPVNSALNPFMYTLSAILGKARFSPSIEENARSESAKELGKAVLNLYPYIALKKGLYNSRLSSLALLLQDGQLTVKELMFIIYRVFKFEDLLHEDDLVLKMIKEEDILIKNGRTGIIGQNVQILTNPVMSTSKKDMANDIYQTGRLLERSLLDLRRRE
ncbi:G-protein coupled receptor GRL101-like [Mercenaria mercenaria]|uniref:G-protein coupled receptor GRL101-like n=1 Tax=Mercenaria mercenaria TaxID=6596 RepID=UPI00234F622B|nr:G-protein coupled receptor GRL101-like [Mercenaria mercenaria]